MKNDKSLKNSHVKYFKWISLDYNQTHRKCMNYCIHTIHELIDQKHSQTNTDTTCWTDPLTWRKYEVEQRNDDQNTD